MTQIKCRIMSGTDIRNCTACLNEIDVIIIFNDEARTLKKIRTSKGDYWVKQWFPSTVSLFKTGTSLKGKNLLPEGEFEKNLLTEGANSFLYEQFLIVWKITFITLSDLPWLLLFLLRTFTACVMGTTSMILTVTLQYGRKKVRLSCTRDVGYFDRE